jgi:Arc/MetJ-type ribon-helix-helix transcriptional regulator
MNPKYPTNVKIPYEYVRLIDENLENGKFARNEYYGRAHVVRKTVYKFLTEHEIRPEVDPDD